MHINIQMPMHHIPIHTHVKMFIKAACMVYIYIYMCGCVCVHIHPSHPIPSHPSIHARMHTNIHTYIYTFKSTRYKEPQGYRFKSLQAPVTSVQGSAITEEAKAKLLRPPVIALDLNNLKIDYRRNYSASLSSPSCVTPFFHTSTAE